MAGRHRPIDARRERGFKPAAPPVAEQNRSERKYRAADAAMQVLWNLVREATAPAIAAMLRDALDDDQFIEAMRHLERQAIDALRRDGDAETKETIRRYDVARARFIQMVRRLRVTDPAKCARLVLAYALTDLRAEHHQSPTPCVSAAGVAIEVPPAESAGALLQRALIAA
jgi:hypothetical protein